MNRSLWVVGSRQRQQMLTQRSSDRDGYPASGRASAETDFFLAKINVGPGKGRHIAETLTRVETELDQALPFKICNSEHRPDFIEGKRTSGRPIGIAVFDDGDE